MTQHLHADADQQSLLPPHRVAPHGPMRVQDVDRHCVQERQQQHHQRQQDIVDEHRHEQHRAHRHVDEEHEKLVRQVLRDPVDGRDPIRQVPHQPVVEEVHRQPEHPGKASVVADHRDPDCEPRQEPVLEQGQDVHQEPAPEQCRHESPPKPMAHENVVHEHAESCGNDQGKQRQHQRTGNRPGKGAPCSGQQAAQLLVEPRRFAAGLETRSALESQGDSAVALAELLRGEPSPPRRRVIEVEPATVDPFDHHEVAELPEHDQGQGQLVELSGAHAESTALEAVVPGCTQDARRAAAVATHLALLAQLGERHPASEPRQYAAETRGSTFRRVRLQDNGRDHPPVRGPCRFLGARPARGVPSHSTAASFRRA